MESVELSSLRHIHLQHLHCQLLVLHPYKHLPRGDVPHGGDGHPQTPHHLRHHRLAPGQACHNCQAGHVRGKGAGRGQLDRDGWVGWCDLCGSRWRVVDRYRAQLVFQVLLSRCFQRPIAEFPEQRRTTACSSSHSLYFPTLYLSSARPFLKCRRASLLAMFLDFHIPTQIGV